MSAGDGGEPTLQAKSVKTDYMTGRWTVNIAIKQLGDALFWPTA